MNYYPFHVGDYTAHTAHLTWEEDIAYRRMLDWYYLNEKALPSDTVKVARLVRMPQSLSVIETVLSEFFAKSDDGWHNKRADAELTSMLAKQEQQNSKDAHEAERMRRYRERRAELFAALRAVGVVPAWDISIKELQRLHDESCNAPATEHAQEPETHQQREQVQNCNAPATAVPTPTPTPTPTPIVKEERDPRKRSSTPVCPDFVDQQVWNDWLAHRKAKRAPVTQTVIDGAIGEAEKAGMPLEDFLRVWCRRGTQGLEAAWLKPDERKAAATSRHNGFSTMNYNEGISDDGSFV